ncbi:MAG TPA: type II secretion system F family protein [Mycobacteriales bacterium]|nr:type II secretion system F family protein [Mycobacteriales bacterium]
MSTTTLLAVLAGAVTGLGLLLLVAALVGLPARDPSTPPLWSRTAASTRRIGGRVGAALAVGVVVLAATGWPVMALGIGLLVAQWDRIAGGGGQERLAILRLDALAVWTESLRDTIAGAVGLEQAIPSSVEATPPVLRPSLNLLVDRLRIREPLPEALLAFADDLDDPSADTVVAALVLNARLRGPGLRDVLTALASSTREELDMRRRIESSRRSVRRSVRIVLLIVLSVVGMLSVLNRTYVAPYDTVTGQAVLLVVALLFLAGLLWLRKLARPEPADRLLGARVALAAGA